MFRRIHSIFGLVGAVLLIVMALSGAFLSMDPVLERLQARQVSGIAVSDLAVNVVAHNNGVESIERKASGLILVHTSGDSGSAVSIVDPATGIKTADYVQSDLLRWVTNLHRSFLMGEAGRGVAGASAAFMVLLSISGGVLLVQRMGGWRNVFKRVRGTGQHKLHADIGRMAILAFVLTGLTACYMSLTTFGFVSDGMDAEPAFPQAVDGGPAMAVGDMPALKSVNVANLRELVFPVQGDLNDVYTLTSSDGVSLIDQATGQTVSTLANSFARTVYETVYMLHTGQGAWWLGMILGLAALSIPFMAISGVVVWWKRRMAMPHIPQNVRGSQADTIILVGSEGNTTWGFARTLHLALSAEGHKVHTAPMNALSAQFTHARQMFILTSTYGDGVAPMSARQFMARLEKMTTVPDYPVTVLGFGDRQFPDFCRFAQDVETAVKAQGWKPGLPLSLIDRQSAQQFQAWGAEVGEVLGHGLSLVYQAAARKTTSFVLTERSDFGQEFQSPATIFRFEAAQPGPKNRLQRWLGKRMPRFEAGDLVGIVPPGSTIPRFYSLASSSRDNVLEICVRKLPGGLCSEFLHSLRPGLTIDAFIQPNPDFRPQPGKKPVILIGAGTGIGPLAGFIRHNHKHRAMHLYFGVRDPQSDFLYETELRGWLADKRLTKLFVAFSRITHRRAYVQDHLRMDSVRIRELVAKGGEILVCGGRDMAKGVKQALEEILSPTGQTVATLKQAGRYREDVY
jgi:sulfite reductase (NADPH) flavoprotein alpha-component